MIGNNSNTKILILVHFKFLFFQKKIMMRVAIKEMETIMKEEEEEPPVQVPSVCLVYPTAQLVQAAIAPVAVAALLVVLLTGATSEYPVAQYLQSPARDPAAEAVPLALSA
jgi:hypothetical protein